jgi:integrase
MLQRDLAEAGIPYLYDGKFADFHRLRHTFVTSLARARVHPKTTQTPARHSTISLTLDVYTSMIPAEQVEALAKLPSITLPRRKAE